MPFSWLCDNGGYLQDFPHKDQSIQDITSNQGPAGKPWLACNNGQVVESQSSFTSHGSYND